MNKKIKIIDVINKIANGEIPKAIKYHNKIYKYVKNEDEEGYLNADFGGDWLINLIHWDDIKELNQEVEIIEEPEIDIKNLAKKNISYVVCRADFNNGQIIKILNEFFSRNQECIDYLLESVKQLDHQINNK